MTARMTHAATIAPSSSRGCTRAPRHLQLLLVLLLVLVPRARAFLVCALDRDAGTTRERDGVTLGAGMAQFGFLICPNDRVYNWRT